MEESFGPFSSRSSGDSSVAILERDGMLKAEGNYILSNGALTEVWDVSSDDGDCSVYSCYTAKDERSLYCGSDTENQNGGKRYLHDLQSVCDNGLDDGDCSVYSCDTCRGDANCSVYSCDGDSGFRLYLESDTVSEDGRSTRNLGDTQSVAGSCFDDAASSIFSCDNNEEEDIRLFLESDTEQGNPRVGKQKGIEKVICDVPGTQSTDNQSNEVGTLSTGKRDIGVQHGNCSDPKDDNNGNDMRSGEDTRASMQIDVISGQCGENRKQGAQNASEGGGGDAPTPRGSGGGQDEGQEVKRGRGKKRGRRSPGKSREGSPNEWQPHKLRSRKRNNRALPDCYKNKAYRVRSSERLRMCLSLMDKDVGGEYPRKRYNLRETRKSATSENGYSSNWMDSESDSDDRSLMGQSTNGEQFKNSSDTVIEKNACNQLSNADIPTPEQRQDTSARKKKGQCGENRKQGAQNAAEEGGGDVPIPRGSGGGQDEGKEVKRGRGKKRGRRSPGKSREGSPNEWQPHKFMWHKDKDNRVPSSETLRMHLRRDDEGSDYPRKKYFLRNRTRATRSKEYEKDDVDNESNDDGLSIMAQSEYGEEFFNSSGSKNYCDSSKFQSSEDVPNAVQKQGLSGWFGEDCERLTWNATEEDGNALSRSGVGEEEDEAAKGKRGRTKRRQSLAVPRDESSGEEWDVRSNKSGFHNSKQYSRTSKDRKKRACSVRSSEQRRIRLALENERSDYARTKYFLRDRGRGKRSAEEEEINVDNESNDDGLSIMAQSEYGDEVFNSSDTINHCDSTKFQSNGNIPTTVQEQGISVSTGCVDGNRDVVEVGDASLMPGGSEDRDEPQNAAGGGRKRGRPRTRSMEGGGKDKEEWNREKRRAYYRTRYPSWSEEKRKEYNRRNLERKKERLAAMMGEGRRECTRRRNGNIRRNQSSRSLDTPDQQTRIGNESIDVERGVIRSGIGDQLINSSAAVNGNIAHTLQSSVDNPAMFQKRRTLGLVGGNAAEGSRSDEAEVNASVIPSGSGELADQGSTARKKRGPRIARSTDGGQEEARESRKERMRGYARRYYASLSVEKKREMSRRKRERKMELRRELLAAMTEEERGECNGKGNMSRRRCLKSELLRKEADVRAWALSLCDQTEVYNVNGCDSNTMGYDQASCSFAYEPSFGAGQSEPLQLATQSLPFANGEGFFVGRNAHGTTPFDQLNEAAEAVFGSPAAVGHFLAGDVADEALRIPGEATWAQCGTATRGPWDSQDLPRGQAAPRGRHVVGGDAAAAASPCPIPQVNCVREATPAVPNFLGFEVGQGPAPLGAPKGPGTTPQTPWSTEAGAGGSAGDGVDPDAALAISNTRASLLITFQLLQQGRVPGVIRGGPQDDDDWTNATGPSFFRESGDESQNVERMSTLRQSEEPSEEVEGADRPPVITRVDGHARGWVDENPVDLKTNPSVEVRYSLPTPGGGVEQSQQRTVIRGRRNVARTSLESTEGTQEGEQEMGKEETHHRTCYAFWTEERKREHSRRCKERHRIRVAAITEEEGGGYNNRRRRDRILRRCLTTQGEDRAVTQIQGPSEAVEVGIRPPVITRVGDIAQGLVGGNGAGTRPTESGTGAEDVSAAPVPVCGPGRGGNDLAAEGRGGDPGGVEELRRGQSSGGRGRRHHSCLSSEERRARYRRQYELKKRRLAAMSLGEREEYQRRVREKSRRRFANLSKEQKRENYMRARENRRRRLGLQSHEEREEIRTRASVIRFITETADQ